MAMICFAKACLNRRQVIPFGIPLAALIIKRPGDIEQRLRAQRRFIGKYL